MEPKNCLPFVIETLSKMELMVRMLHSVVNELFESKKCTSNSGVSIDDCRSQMKNMDQSIALEFLKYALDSFGDNSDQSLGNNSSANITTNNILVTVPGCTDGPTANTNLNLIPLTRLSVGLNHSDGWIVKNLSNISNLVEGPLLNDNDSETSFLAIPEHFEKDKDKENVNDTESEKSWDETTTNVNSIESFEPQSPENMELDPIQVPESNVNRVVLPDIDQHESIHRPSAMETDQKVVTSKGKINETSVLVKQNVKSTSKKSSRASIGPKPTPNSKSKRYKCQVEGCIYATARRDHFRIHNQKHRRDKSFGCKVCSKNFKTQNLLNEHMEQHNDQWSFLCSYCTQTFGTKDDRDNHEKNCKSSTICTKEHDVQSLFECNLCEKKFKRPQILLEHYNVHEDIEKNVK